MAKEKVGHSVSQSETKIEAIKRAVPWRREVEQLRNAYQAITALFDSQRRLIAPVWDSDAGVEAEAAGFRQEGKISSLVFSRPVANPSEIDKTPLKIQQLDHFYHGTTLQQADVYYLHPDGNLTKEIVNRPGTSSRETAQVDITKKEKRELFRRLSNAEMYRLKTS